MPDCKATLGADDVPLAEDLSNATIATCKAYGRPIPVPTPKEDLIGPYKEQHGKNYTYWQPAQIYDPVWYTSENLYDHEHQVSQHQHGHINPTSGIDGPHGDWYMYGKPLSEEQWPVKNLVQIYQSEEDPSDISIVQLNKEENKKWVELPDCDGTPGEKKLDDSLANASWATCKKNPKNPATGKKQAADSALDSMTPKKE